MAVSLFYMIYWNPFAKGNRGSADNTLTALLKLIPLKGEPRNRIKIALLSDTSCVYFTLYDNLIFHTRC